MSELPPITYTLEYPYTRTTGPVVGAFLTALRDGRILGSRCGDRVIWPPLEFDPDTAEPIAQDLVEVGPGLEHHERRECLTELVVGYADDGRVAEVDVGSL